MLIMEFYVPQLSDWSTFVKLSGQLTFLQLILSILSINLVEYLTPRNWSHASHATGGG